MANPFEFAPPKPENPKCQTCNGTGYAKGEKCKTCNGTGIKRVGG